MEEERFEAQKGLDARDIVCYWLSRSSPPWQGIPAATRSREQTLLTASKKMGTSVLQPQEPEFNP